MAVMSKCSGCTFFIIWKSTNELIASFEVKASTSWQTDDDSLPGLITRFNLQRYLLNFVRSILRGVWKYEVYTDECSFSSFVCSLEKARSSLVNADNLSMGYLLCRASFICVQWWCIRFRSLLISWIAHLFPEFLSMSSG